MGYRSDVAYLFSAPPEKMAAFLVTAKLSHPSIATTIAELVRQPWPGNTEIELIGMEFDSVKWYEGYPEIQAHTALWDYAFEHQEEFKLSGKFIRLGEEYNDIETKGFGDDPLYELIDVRVSIEKNLDFIQQPASKD